MKPTGRLLVSLLVAATAAAASEPAPSLFTPVEGPLDPSLASVESRRIAVEAALLTPDLDEVRLDLPGVGPVFARLTSFEDRGAGGVTWRGVLAGEDGGGVTLTSRRGFVAGLVTGPVGVWEIRTLADGGQAVDRIDQARYPVCGTPQPAQPVPFLGDVDPCPAPVDPVGQVDVLSLYTPQARDASGGVPQIEALIQAAVDNTNTAFLNSEMPIRFRLVGTALADHDDSGNISTDLNWLRNDSEAAALRDSVRADLVSLITQDGGGFCGLGQLPLTWGAGGNPNSVFQVTARGCAVGNLSYAHEHGHNMGLEHNPQNANPPGAGSYPYRFGHYVNGSYRTVMSYSSQCTSGCTRVTQWSNPEVVFLGEPTGLEDQRDNRRASGLTDGCVTDYRLSDPAIFSDGFESGDTSAWSTSLP